MLIERNRVNVDILFFQIKNKTKKDGNTLQKFENKVLICGVLG